MGFVPINDDFATLRTPIGPKEPEPGPRRIERDESLFMPAWRTQNIIGSGYAAETYPGKYPSEPGHDPLSIIAGTKYETENLDSFVGSESPAETRARMRQIDRENKDRERLDTSGWPGLVAQVGAGTIDPTIAFPGGSLVRSARGGYSLIRSMANVGTSGLAAVTAQEAALHGSQFTRTMEESAGNIASATILAGLLGAGASRWATAAERAAGIQALDQIKREISQPDRARVLEAVQKRAATGEAIAPELQEFFDSLPPEILNGINQGKPEAMAFLEKHFDGFDFGRPSATGLAASAGAAAADTRQLVPTEMVPAIVGRAYDRSRALLERAGELPGVRAIPGVRQAVGLAGKAASAVLGTPEWLIKRSGPLTRMAYSGSTAGKRATFDLVESPIEFRDNKAFIPTSRNGPAVETTARIAIDGARYKLTQELDRLFGDYYFGGEQRLGKLKAKVDQIRGTTEGRMTFKEFKGAVRDAMINGDNHPVPQVDAAAKWLRKEVFDPWKEAAIRLKLLPEDVTVKTAQSYFMRVYDKAKIVAQRPEFTREVKKWLTEDQSVKAQLKNDLQGNRDLRAERTRSLRKLERRLETIQRRQDEVEARLGEREIEVNQAGKRVDALKDRQSAAADELTDLDEVIRDLKDTVRNPELKAELQQLERELSDLKRADKPVTMEDLARADKEEEAGILTGPLRRAARIATGQVKPPKPPSFAAYISKEGGIKDTGGDVLATIGDRTKAPGLITTAGRSLDQWGEKLTQDFPEVFIERPSPDEVLELIGASIIGDQPQWFLQARMKPEELEAIDMANMIQFAAQRAGLDLKSPADVAELFRNRDPRDLADLEDQINGMAEGASAIDMTMPPDPYRLGDFITARPGGNYIHLGQFEPRNPAEIGREAGQYVIEQGKKVNGEAIVILDGNGNILADGTGSARQVAWPKAASDAFITPGADMIVHHNHPSSTSLSSPDVSYLAFPGLSVVWAHGDNGKDVYRASLPPALRQVDQNDLAKAIWKSSKAAENKLYDALSKLTLAGKVNPDTGTAIMRHLQNQALHNAGLIDYFSNYVAVLPAGSGLAEMLKAATDAAQFVAEVQLKNDPALAAARSSNRAAVSLRHIGDMGIASPYSGGPAGRRIPEGGNAGRRPEVGGAQASRTRPEQLKFPGFEEGIRSELQAQFAGNIDELSPEAQRVYDAIPKELRDVIQRETMAEQSRAEAADLLDDEQLAAMDARQVDPRYGEAIQRMNAEIKRMGFTEDERALPPYRDPTIPIRLQREGMEQTVNVRRESLEALKKEIEKFKGYRQTAEGKAGREAARGSEAELRLRNSIGGVTKKDGTVTRGRRGVLQDRSSRLDTAREIMDRARANVQAEIDDLRLSAEEKLLQWQGKSAGDAQAALKRRAEAERIRDLKKEAGVYGGKDERLTGADRAVDAAIKRIIRSDRDKLPEELESLADEIVDRIIGSPDGRLPYDLPTGGPKVGPPSDGPPPRGPLAHREFMIPDERIKDWLVDDVEQVAHTYLGSIVPDVLITERFGDVDMTQAFRQINEEYNAKMRAAGSEEERIELRREQERVIGDLAAQRDRIRGTYGMTSDTVMRNAARIAGAAGSLNVMADMGGSALSQLPDLSGPVFRHGFGTVFRDGWMPFFKGMTEGKKSAIGKAKRQYNAMGIAVDMVHNTRNLDEVGEQYHPRTKGERMLKGGAQAFMNVNLSAPMTDGAKTIAAVVAGNEIFRATKAVAEGKATKRQITDLAAASIDEEMATRIWQSFQESGAVEDGVYLPNTADWSDAGARRSFEGAVSREANIAVVTPGQEKALWLSNPVLKILGQFKAFIASSSVRILAANLQRRDAQTLQGLIGSIAMGMLGYKAYTMATGQPASERWEDWVKEGISRAGVLGWLDEGNSFTSKFTRGQLDLYRLVGADKPLTRYASRGVLGALLGPTAGKIENLSQAVGALASGEFMAKDTRAARRLMPLQNLFYIRQLLNQVEEGFNAQFGIPEGRQ